MTTVNTIGNFEAAGTAPGNVPLGGIIAMTTGLTGAMAIPASGVVSNGYMRADGVAIPGGNKVSGTPPNLSDSVYLRGFTSYSPTPGGSNTYTPAGTNSTSSVPASGLGFSGSSTTYSVSVPAHYHGIGSGAGLTAAGQSYTGNTDTTGSAHTHDQTIYNNTNPGGGTLLTGNSTSVNPYGYTTAGTTGSTHTHGMNHTHGPSNVTGTIGLVSGGADGNSAFTASGSNTPSGSITGTATAAAQIFTGTPGNNEPNYINVVYLIRVS